MSIENGGKNAPLQSIVLIEDHAPFRAFLTHDLQEYFGYNLSILAYEDATSAFNDLGNRGRIDLFLIDLKLSANKTGIDFLQMIQLDHSLMNTPKVIISDLAKTHISLS